MNLDVPDAFTAQQQDALRRVRRTLQTARRRAKLALIVRACAFMGGTGIAVGTAMALLDYALRMPVALRLAVLIGALAAAWTWARRVLLPSLLFNPTLSEVALRLERSKPGQAAGLPGLLASAVDLSADAPADDDERARRAAAIDRAILAFDKAPTLGAFLTLRHVWAMSVIAVLIAMPAAVLTLRDPGLAMTAAQRVLLPWSGAAWPKRTQVVDITTAAAHPLGMALPLRAVARLEGSVPSVMVRYRLVGQSERGIERREPLIAQGRDMNLASGIRGSLYERLIDPTSLAAQAGPPSATSDALYLEYWFQSEDDATSPRRVRLVEPPSVVSASVTIVPPSYAADALAASSWAIGEREIGPGRDQASLTGPVLAGSAVSLVVRFNKDVPLPAEAASVFVDGAPASEPSISRVPGGWRIDWTAEQTAHLVIAAQDEYGISAISDSNFVIQVLADKAPDATVLEPVQDENVLASAVVDVVGEGRDDVGLASVALERTVVRAPAESAGAPAASSESPVEFAAASLQAPARSGRVQGSLSLADFGVKPRDEVQVVALATDRSAAGPTGPSRSSVRRLRIIDQSDFVEQIRAELGAVSNAARRLDKDQGEAEQALDKSPRDAAARQQSITERLSAPSDLVARLASRAERNRLGDESLTSLLAKTGEALRDAAEASNRAQSAAERAAAQPEGSDQERTAREATAGEQAAVRDALGRVASMLDSGQDGWAARRSIERLLDEQRKLSEETRAAGRDTAGRQASQLAQEQAQALDRLAERQRDLAGRTATALDELETRAQKLRQTDPGRAEAMRQAAQNARRNSVDQRQRQAAEQIRQNQTSTANQSQQKAEDALSEALRDIDKAQQNRDQALRRVLTELADAIQRLIDQQQAAIDALAASAPDAEKLAPLASAMIRINGSTVALVDQVRSGDDQTASVAEPLANAAAAQANAISALRGKEPDAKPDAAAADREERISLIALGEALELVKKLSSQMQQRDQNQRVQELRQAYGAALEEQIALKEQTTPFLGKQLDRRQRASVRAIGEAQQALGATLATLASSTEGLSDTELFSFAHERLALVVNEAAESLRKGEPTARVGRDQTTAVGLLRSMVEALSADPKSDPFREGEGGGGGGGGGGGQQGGKQKPVPPLAELKLLKFQQQDAADRTRALGQNDAFDPQEAEDVKNLQRQLAERAERLLKALKDSQAPQPDPREPPAPGPRAPTTRKENQP